MKSTFTIIIITLFFTNAAGAQVSLGLKGGYVNAELYLTTSRNNVKPGTNHLNGWQTGLYANIPLFNAIHLQPGLSYIVKGANLQYEPPKSIDLFTAGATVIKLKYLEMPVNLVYKLPVNLGKIIVGTGPYLAYSLKGNYEMVVYNDETLIKTSSQQLNFNQSPNIFATDISLQRWDAGINMMVGMEFNNFITFEINYSHGLMDLDKSVNHSMRNRYVGVSLGLLFNREDW